jgi:hypothetical protein
VEFARTWVCARNTWNKNKTHEEMQATNRREIGITKLFGCDLSDVKHVVIVEDIKVEDVHIGVRDTVNPGMACDISENRSAEG